MTIFQIISSIFAFFTTVYYISAIIRTNTYHSLNWLQALIWATAVVLCIASYAGIQ